MTREIRTTCGVGPDGRIVVPVGVGQSQRLLDLIPQIRATFSAAANRTRSAGVIPFEMRPRASNDPLISSFNLIITPRVLPQRYQVSG